MTLKPLTRLFILCNTTFPCSQHFRNLHSSADLNKMCIIQACEACQCFIVWHKVSAQQVGGHEVRGHWCGQHDGAEREREQFFLFTSKSKVKGENKGWMGNSFPLKNLLQKYGQMHCYDLVTFFFFFLSGHSRYKSHYITKARCSLYIYNPKNIHYNTQYNTLLSYLNVNVNGNLSINSAQCSFQHSAASVILQMVDLCRERTKIVLYYG